MIIGITGTNASGKGTTAEFLITLGYSYHSLSDEIREECKKQNLELTRDNLIKTGNDFRVKFGPEIWAKKTNDKIKEKDAVIDSIRSPIEVDELRKNKDFILIAVDAHIEKRYERAMKRKREGEEKLTLEAFKKKEEQETTSDKNAQQILNAMKMADYKIINDGTKEQLKEQLNQILKNADQ